MAARKAEEDKNPIGYANNHHNPTYECQRAIEKLAKYDFKWKDDFAAARNFAFSSPQRFGVTAP